MRSVLKLTCGSAKKSALPSRSFPCQRRWHRYGRGKGTPLVRTDIADILGTEVYAGEFERAEWAFIDVGELAVVNHKLIDLQRVNFFHRLLPAALFNGNLVVDFFLGLLAIDVDLWAVDLKSATTRPNRMARQSTLAARTGIWATGGSGLSF